MRTSGREARRLVPGSTRPGRSAARTAGRTRRGEAHADLGLGHPGTHGRGGIALASGDCALEGREQTGLFSARNSFPKFPDPSDFAGLLRSRAARCPEQEIWMRARGRNELRARAGGQWHRSRGFAMTSYAVAALPSKIAQPRSNRNENDSSGFENLRLRIFRGRAPPLMETGLCSPGSMGEARRWARVREAPEPTAESQGTAGGAPRKPGKSKWRRAQKKRFAFPPFPRADSAPRSPATRRACNQGSDRCTRVGRAPERSGDARPRGWVRASG